MSQDETPQNIPESESDEAQPQQIITVEIVESAEKILGLEFTESEREQMLGTLNGRLDAWDELREQAIPNDITPALYFDPRPSPPDPQPALREYHTPVVGEIKRPDNLEDVAFWTVTQLAELIRTKQVTSLELTEMYLSRLKRYDPTLECVVTLTEERAIEQAKQADEEIKAGNYRGPLHGIPWGAKDLLATKGYKTTWGAMPYKDQIIDMDATVVQRLDEAGAVLVAKLTLGALAYGDIWYGGRTNNPWNIAEGSSGSSAGPASAVAGGLVGFAIGTETLGSIVSPSTQCGVSGLRPTFGRVSRHGAMALSWSMDKIGPMCRSAEDCALVMSAIYGADGHDPTMVNEQFTWSPERSVHDLRVGYLKSAFENKRRDRPNETHESKNGNDLAVLDVLRDMGIDLIEFELPDVPLQAMMTILMVEGAAAFDDITRNDLDDSMQWQDDQAWPNLFRAARFIPAVEYVQANRLRTKMIREVAKVMESIDVFVMPSYGGMALVVTNLTGHPTAVVPDGFNEEGLPTSISFVGGLYKDAEALTVAHAYQQATDWHNQHPSMDWDD